MSRWKSFAVKILCVGLPEPAGAVCGGIVWVYEPRETHVLAQSLW